MIEIPMVIGDSPGYYAVPVAGWGIKKEEPRIFLDLDELIRAAAGSIRLGAAAYVSIYNARNHTLIGSVTSAAPVLTAVNRDRHEAAG
jgi:hypothetical protein